MIEIHIDTLIALDKEFAEEGIAPHQRPWAAALRILGEDLVFERVPDPDRDAKTKGVMDLYTQKFPNCKGWPGMGVGLVASMDSIKRVIVPVVYGSLNMPTWKSLGFETEMEWKLFINGSETLADRHFFDVIDLHDFTYGMSDKGGKGAGANLWYMARSYLEVSASQLETGVLNPGVVQSISLVVETSLKAALLELGVSETVLRNKPYGHNLVNLAQKLSEISPHNDDKLIKILVKDFPPFVGSRYAPGELRRLDRVRLATIAQFIAGSAMRRVSDRNLLEAAIGDFPKRKEGLYRL